MKPLLTLMTAALCVLALLGSSPAEAGTQDPDMLVIVLDSWRADSLEREVEGVPVMPRLRAWSKRASVFTEARAPSPSTPTSVSSMLTSLSVRAYGGTFNTGLPEGAVSIAEVLKAEGYATQAFSANPNVRLALGHGQGFDLFEEAFADPELLEDERRIRGDHPALMVPPERLFGMARASLNKAEAGTPLLAYIHVLQPHAPYRAAKPHAGLFAKDLEKPIPLEIQALTAREQRGKLDNEYLRGLRAHYDDHTHWTDAALGAFLAWVDSHPRWSKAAIIVTSDHGEAFGEHGKLLHNSTLYEEMLRIPLIVRLPGGPAEGRRIDAPAGLIDLAPTLAALADTAMPELAEGIDLGPLAAGLDVEPRRRFLASTAPIKRQDALLIGSRKLICKGDRCELYDLKDDPGETRDLSEIRDVQRDAMKSALEKLIARLDESGLESGPAQTPSENVESILRSLGYTGGD